jgi:acyl-coenzyme A thioesterase PaaI-like protein
MSVSQSGLAGLVAAAEQAAEAALRATTDRPVALVTLNLDVLSAGSSQDAVGAYAHITRQTRTLAFLDVSVRAGDLPVLSAAAVYRIIQDRETGVP